MLSSLLSSDVSGRLIQLSNDEGVTFGVDGFLPYQFFGEKVWLTTTHITMLIVMLAD